MKTFLAMLIILVFGIPASAQNPAQTGMWGPRKSSVLYQTLIKYGTHREEEGVRIWTDDNITVRISTTIDSLRIMFVADDNGLKEVWMCKDVQWQKAGSPIRIRFSEEIAEQTIAHSQRGDLPGHPDILIIAITQPTWSVESVYLRKMFVALVDKFSAEDIFHQ